MTQLPEFAGRLHPGPATFRDAGRAQMTQPARFDTIGTDRLLMRRWLASDREPFAALNADPETMLFFPETLDRYYSPGL
jgi:RimJ/RimL family protein N-acetyltransferase